MSRDERQINRVFVEYGPQFKSMAQALRDLDKTFPRQLRAAMRKTATPIIRDVRRAALELPADGVKQSGLRGRLAAGVGVRIGVGKNAYMRFTTKMPAGQEALPRGEDSGIAGWRHPVYALASELSGHGHGWTWVHQDGSSWFRDTIANDRPQLQRSLQQVLDDAAQKVSDSGDV